MSNLSAISSFLVSNIPEQFITRTIAALLLLVGTAVMFHRVRGDSRRKGPMSFPGLGNFPQIFFGITYRDLPKLLLNWSKRYGRLFHLDFGRYRTIILTDGKLIRKAFGHPNISGRPRMLISSMRMMHDLYGILMNDGTCWEEQRRFVERKFKEYGEQNFAVHSVILEKARNIIYLLHKNENKPISTTMLFNTAMMSVMWSIISGKRLHDEEARLHTIAGAVVRGISETGKSGIILFLPEFAKAFPNLSGWNEHMKAHQMTRTFINEFVTLRSNHINEDVNNDFTAAYIEQINKTTNETSSFYGQRGMHNLITTLDDLLIAGTETVGTTLSWIFLCLALHPEVQDNVYSEIENIIGQETLPNMNCRGRMVYTEAVVNEVLRLSSVVIIGIPHRCTEETALEGTIIPKDTLVISNLHGVHHDPDVWPDPKRFLPERFLCQPNGGTVRDKFIPFSVGKRRCPGEALARAEIFLVLTSVIQRFQVTLDGSVPKPSLDAIYPGLIAKPENHKLIFSSRQ